MRKILYNRLTKGIIGVTILSIVAVILVLTISLADDIITINERSYMRTEEMDPYFVCDRLMRNVSETLIYNYLNEGMDSIYEVVEDIFNEYGKGCVRVVFTDGEDIYCNVDKALERYDESMDVLEFVEEKFIYPNAIYDVYSQVYYSSSNPKAQFKENRWDSFYEYEKPVYAYIDTEYVNEIEDRNLKIAFRVYIPFEYYWDAYAEYFADIRSFEEDNSEACREVMQEHFEKMVIPGLCLIVLLILSVIACGNTVEGKKELNRYEKADMELHGAIIIADGLGIVGLIYLFAWYIDHFHKDYFMVEYGDITKIVWTILSVAAVGVMLYEIGIIIKKLKNKCFIKSWFVIRFIAKLTKWLKRKVKGAYLSLKRKFYRIYDDSKYNNMPDVHKQYVKKVASDIIMVISAVLIIFMCIMELNYGDAGYTVLALIILAVMLTAYFVLSFKQYNHLRVYNKITKAVDTIVEGRYKEIEPQPAECNDTLNKLCNVSVGFEESVRKQVEAEKMQIELVANVSHDLKTPLTSIISYVDLLKEEEMSDVAKDYVSVLVDKSARLKDIVADVFDLAKATSGEQVLMEQLDGVVLINQVLSDMSDRIEESGKDLRIKIDEGAAPIKGNGQKLYRVFQNVIDNALKYSMPGTRIYLTAQMLAGEFIVTLKNISEFEMEFTEQEIMSRFTRGDKSRHSEGNGLGLSIAKSFTELCGGEFNINIDDDVFKVIIKLR